MKPLALLATAALAVCAPAQAYEVKTCTFNDRNPMAVSFAWNDYGFSIRWADGVGNRYTYGPGPALVTDTIGGRWVYRGSGSTISLTHSYNGNRIFCF